MSFMGLATPSTDRGEEPARCVDCNDWTHEPERNWNALCEPCQQERANAEMEAAAQAANDSQEAMEVLS
jgi:hypothetical protein